MVIGAAQNGETTNYTYGLERISALASKTRTEYVYDGRGSVAAEVSYNDAWYTFGGGLARKNATAKSYTPFGEQNGEQASGFGYNGEYYNAATGMIYLRARFYEPEMNRFAQKDTLRGSIIDGISLNRYLYVQNDPVNFADYNGQRMVAVNVADGGGSGKTSTTPKKTPAPSSASNPPRAYTNPYHEYTEQRRAATTPSAQDYAQLMRSGAHMSYAQYAYEKSHTVFPSFADYMNGKQTGRPYYTTVSQGKPSKVPYQRSYYTGSRTSPSVVGVTNAPGYDCGLNINALGAGNYGAEQAVDAAKEKYNEDTVHVYKLGEGNENPDKFNLYVYQAGDYLNIAIPDSLEINSYAEQSAILDVLMDSKYYSVDLFGTKAHMMAQWVVHNATHGLASSGEIGFAIAQLSGSEDPIESSRQTDLRQIGNTLKRQDIVYALVEAELWKQYGVTWK